MNTCCIVIGAGAIGGACADLLASSGEDLLVVDHDAEALARVAAQHPDRIETLKLDMTCADEVRKLAALFDDKKNDIRSLVIALGTEGMVAPVEDVPEEDLDRAYAINVKAPWLAVRAALPSMKAAKRGSIVVLASSSGLAGTPLLSSYCVTKHAVIGLVRAVAREVAPFNIRINAVAPGPVASPMMNRIDSGLLDTNPGRFGGAKDAATSIPLGRYADPMDVANLVSFLCSDASSYLTGGAMAVDGGWLSR